jgi:hypothetical protein
MHGRLLFLNLALAVGVGTAGWKLYANYRADQAKREAFLRRTASAAPVAAHTPSDPGRPLQAASYLPVAQQMVFSKDRNPDVINEIAPAAAPPPPPPVPPFPAAYGMIGLAGDVVVLLGDAGKQKGYRLGDTVGPFKLSAIKGEELTLEWNGQEFKKTLTELKKLGVAASATAQATSTPVSSGATPAAVATRADGQPMLTRITPKEVYEKELKTGSGPGFAAGAGPDRACDPNDNSPAGTVQGGYRKRVTPSPFGSICIWEPVRQ